RGLDVTVVLSKVKSVIEKLQAQTKLNLFDILAKEADDLSAQANAEGKELPLQKAQELLLRVKKLQSVLWGLDSSVSESLSSVPLRSKLDEMQLILERAINPPTQMECKEHRQ